MSVYKYETTSSYGLTENQIDVAAYIFWDVLMDDIMKKIHQGKYKKFNPKEKLRSLHTELDKIAKKIYAERWWATRALPFAKALNTYITKNIGS